MAGAPLHGEGCEGRLVQKLELDYGETVEPSGGVLVCNACYVAVDPEADAEPAPDPIADAEPQPELP